MEHDGIDVPFLKDVLSNHLCYAMTLSVIPISKRKMDGMLLTIQRVSNSIGMSTGLNKCAISTLDKGEDWR